MIGEGCHFVDLACFLSRGELASVHGTFRQPRELGGGIDDFAVSLRFSSGDLATVHYATGGHPSLSKERIEAIGCGYSFVVDDFHSMSSFGRRTLATKAGAGDRGFRGHLANFFSAIRGTAALATTVEDGVRVAAVFQTLMADAHGNSGS